VKTISIRPRHDAVRVAYEVDDLPAAQALARAGLAGRRWPPADAMAEVLAAGGGSWDHRGDEPRG
jgi:hypothetical protein